VGTCGGQTIFTYVSQDKILGVDVAGKTIRPQIEKQDAVDAMGVLLRKNDRSEPKPLQHGAMIFSGELRVLGSLNIIS